VTEKGAADATDATDATDSTVVTTVTGPVVRRVVAVGSKSEREATVVVLDGRPVVLRRRDAGAFDDDPGFAALVGSTATLTGTLLSTTFLVDEASPVDPAAT
jgi:hypothetical protein